LNNEITVSVVIPVLEDAASLEAILETLHAAPSGPDEIIVVDGGSGDECVTVALQHECAYLRTRPGRGHQLDAGGNCASDDVIWFLHADAHPGDSAIESIRRAIEDGATGGYFRFRFTGKLTWYKRLLARLINWRAQFGIPYGDQGLFFRKSDYIELGGFADAPLFEEVMLVKAARRSGPFVEIANPIGVSSRRWERDGWLRRTLENRLLALGYILGISPHRLAHRYRQ
jgi:rSAM/selenodomain-associated transferase 2